MNDRTQLLLAEARKARENAYAPYSRFRVGAALLTTNGRLFSGCNVENASFGLTICAERSAIFQMVAAGEKEIELLLIIGDSDAPLPPCGGCRQVIAEFARPETRVIMCDRDGGSEEVSFADIFPRVFFLE